jgi:hypothetical protein
VKDGPEGWKVGKDISKKYDDLKARGIDVRMCEVRPDDDEEAHSELDKVITGEENLDQHEDEF